MKPDDFLVGQQLKDCLELRRIAQAKARDPEVSKEEFEQWLRSYSITPNPAKSKITNFYLLDRRLNLICGSAYKLALNKELPVEMYDEIGSFIPVYERDYRLGIPPYKEDLWIWLQRKLGIRFQPELTNYVDSIVFRFQSEPEKARAIVRNSLEIERWSRLLFQPLNSFASLNRQYMALRNMTLLIPLLQKFFDNLNLKEALVYQAENIAAIRDFAIKFKVPPDEFDEWLAGENRFGTNYLLYYTILYQLHQFILANRADLAPLLLANISLASKELSFQPYLFKYLVNAIQIASILTFDEFRDWKEKMKLIN